MKQPEPIPAELLEASEDLHTDAMRATTSNLDELVERGRDRRATASIDLDEQADYQAKRRKSLHRNLKGAGAFAGLGVLPGLVSWLTSSNAEASMDVQAAQTAAALENLAIAVYGKAAALPFMAKIPDPAGSTVTTFVKKTVKQHTDHAGAFNAAVKKLGGKEQTGIDQVVMDKVVTPALTHAHRPAESRDVRRRSRARRRRRPTPPRPRRSPTPTCARSSPASWAWRTSTVRSCSPSVRCSRTTSPAR